MDTRAVELENENGITYIYILGDNRNDWPPGVYATLDSAMAHAHKHEPELTWDRDDTFDLWRPVPRQSGWTIYRRPLMGLPWMKD